VRYGIRRGTEHPQLRFVGLTPSCATPRRGAESEAFEEKLRIPTGVDSRRSTMPRVATPSAQAPHGPVAIAVRGTGGAVGAESGRLRPRALAVFGGGDAAGAGRAVAARDVRARAADRRPLERGLHALPAVGRVEAAAAADRRDVVGDFRRPGVVQLRAGHLPGVAPLPRPAAARRLRLRVLDVDEPRRPDAAVRRRRRAARARRRGARGPPVRWPRPALAPPAPPGPLPRLRL